MVPPWRGAASTPVTPRRRRGRTRERDSTRGNPRSGAPHAPGVGGAVEARCHGSWTLAGRPGGGPWNREVGDESGPARPRGLDGRPRRVGTRPLVVLPGARGLRPRRAVAGGARRQAHLDVVDVRQLLSRSRLCRGRASITGSRANALPARTRDVKTAVRWRRTHAAHHGYDPAPSPPSVTRPVVSSWPCRPPRPERVASTGRASATPACRAPCRRAVSSTPTSTRSPSTAGRRRTPPTP